MRCVLLSMLEGICRENAAATGWRTVARKLPQTENFETRNSAHPAQPPLATPQRDPANLSGFAPREGLRRLAGYLQLLAWSSGDCGANVSGLPKLPDVLAMGILESHHKWQIRNSKLEQS